MTLISAPVSEIHHPHLLYDCLEDARVFMLFATNKSQCFQRLPSQRGCKFQHVYPKLLTTLPPWGFPASLIVAPASDVKMGLS